MSIRVLLAEPELALLDTYRDYLTRDGFQVETASTGPDCLGKLREWKPDVLVLEPDMPDGWGKKILAEASEAQERRCLPILILTRRDHKVLTHPVREYYVKPLPMAELAKSIRAAVNQRPASKT